ncbi:MAG TPA: flagellar biosynthesis regulator FlaF [Rhodospirillales bacterium]|jgi:flagellar biosynthesis regulator FlaF
MVEPAHQYEQGWTVAEEQAFQLSQAAIRVDQARRVKDKNPAALVDALNRNVEVWVALRSIVMREDCRLADEVKQNLTKLAQFVADRTFADGEIADTTLNALININLQISEGLLEGLNRS